MEVQGYSAAVFWVHEALATQIASEGTPSSSAPSQSRQLTAVAKPEDQDTQQQAHTLRLTMENAAQR